MPRHVDQGHNGASWTERPHHGAPTQACLPSSHVLDTIITPTFSLSHGALVRKGKGGKLVPTWESPGVLGLFPCGNPLVAGATYG